MRASLLLLLVACDAGEKRAPPPPSPPARGSIEGKLQVAIHGPGANDGRKPYTNVHGVPCKVTATSTAGETFEVTTPETGELKLELPAGRYTISFASCAAPGCSYEEQTREVDVQSGAKTTVDWSCDLYAK